MSPQKLSNPTTVVTECCNIAETQEGPLNNPVDMIKILKKKSVNHLKKSMRAQINSGRKEIKWFNA